MEENKRNERELKLKLCLAVLVHLGIILIVASVCIGAAYVHPSIGAGVAYFWGASNGANAFKSVGKVVSMSTLIFQKWD